jgi:hypothetical protein
MWTGERGQMREEREIKTWISLNLGFYSLYYIYYNNIDEQELIDLRILFVHNS